MVSLCKETPYSEITATLEILDKWGVTRELLADLQANNGDNSLAKGLAQFMRYHFKESIDQRIARAILRENFFGVEEWSSLCNVRFTRQQLRNVPRFPWDEHVLNAPCPFIKGKRVAETHFAFLGIDILNRSPLTIMKLHEVFSPAGQPKLFFYANPWYETEPFATEATCELRWYLMPLSVMPDSMGKVYEDQLKMLPENYEVPSAVAEVMKRLLYSRKTGIYLDHDRCGRCQDQSTNGNRVWVGFSGPSGVYISACGDNESDEMVGLATSRKAN